MDLVLPGEGNVLLSLARDCQGADTRTNASRLVVSLQSVVDL